MIDYIYKDLFARSDTKKELLITFDEGTITNHEMHQGSFTLEESLCSESSLVFGTCESSILKFKVHNIFTDLKNKWLDVSLVLNGDTSNPFQIGRFKVESDIPTADRKKRDVTAYDVLHDIINSDVAEWYNSILPNKNSTVTMKQFRSSFFSHFYVDEADIELVNDSMTVAKTIQPEELSGKTVINAICEINGCFGHIGRDGKFHYVYLEPIREGLYPSNDLYPANDLFPVQPNTELIGKGAYIPPCTYEAYKVQGITGLQIRKEENDIGVTVGTKDNLYVIEDNILVYGKSTSDLTAIANNILEKIQKLVYRPFNTKAVGNPCIEVGDPVRLNTKTQKIESYVLQRTITGVKAMRDTYTSEGVEYLPKASNSLAKQIIELKGKSNTLTRNLEETKLEIKDVESGLISVIAQTATDIRAEVSDIQNGLNSKIEINASAISAEVSRAKSEEEKLSSRITVNSESITAEVNRATKAEGNLSASIKINADAITSEVTRAKNAENSLSSSITQTAESIRSEVSETYSTKTETTNAVNGAITSANNSTDQKLKSYSTTVQMNSAIEQKADSITSTVNKQITETKTYADTVASTAESNAKADTTNKLKSYSTTTQMNTAISQSAESINLSVSKQITETKTYADTVASTAESNAKADTTEKLKSYSTTVQMQSAISLSEQGIISTVSATYETKLDAESSYTSLSSSISQNASSITAEVKRAKDAEKELSSSITITAEKIESKVSIGEISSKISQEAGKISISSNRISIDSTYFTLTEQGKITASEVELSGKITATSGYIGSKTNGFAITDSAIYNGKTGIDSTSQGVYIGTDGIACGSYADFWIPTYPFSWTKVQKPTFQVTKEGSVYIGAGSLTLGSGSDDIVVIGGGILELYEKITNKSDYHSVSLHNNQITVRSGTSGSKQTCTYTESAITVTKGLSSSSKKRFDILSDILNIAYSGGKLGFFEETPVAQQSVTSISNTSTATTSTIATTVNNLITALKNYGLLS